MCGAQHLNGYFDRFSDDGGVAVCRGRDDEGGVKEYQEYDGEGYVKEDGEFCQEPHKCQYQHHDKCYIS